MFSAEGLHFSALVAYAIIAVGIFETHLVGGRVDHRLKYQYFEVAEHCYLEGCTHPR